MTDPDAAELVELLERLEISMDELSPEAQQVASIFVARIRKLREENQLPPDTWVRT